MLRSTAGFGGWALTIYIVRQQDTNNKIDIVTMFADDSTITVTDPNEDILNNKITMLAAFTTWWDSNKLILKTSKTSYINFYNRKPCRLQNFNFSSQCEFLVVLDADLSWRFQIDIVCKKLKSISSLYKLKMFVTYISRIIVWPIAQLVKARGGNRD